MELCTNNDSCEGTFFSIIFLVHHTDKGSVGSWLPYRRSMDQILQSLHTQVTCLLCQHEADGIHKVGLSYKHYDDIEILVNFGTFLYENTHVKTMLLLAFIHKQQLLYIGFNIPYVKHTLLPNINFYIPSHILISLFYLILFMIYSSCTLQNGETTFG